MRPGPGRGGLSIKAPRGLPKVLGLISWEVRPRSLTTPVCPEGMGAGRPLGIRPFVFFKKNFFGIHPAALRYSSLSKLIRGPTMCEVVPAMRIQW